MKKSLWITGLIFAALLTSCASKPKRTMLITTVATSAATQIENANSSIASGNYINAEYFLNNAYKMAMSIDSYDLLVSIDLTRVSTFLSETPVKLDDAKDALERAKNNAKNATNVDKATALCGLNEVRINLSEENPDFDKCISILKEDRKKVEKLLFEAAQFDSVKGDVYRNQKKYTEAEKAYLDALEIFTKECYLSELGVNWYKVAQVRSLGGNKKGALEALELAIKYDRDSENSFALGTDYYAKGIVLMKDNPTAEEKNAAKTAFIHSADIFNSAELPDMAQRSMDKLESYTN